MSEELEPGYTVYVQTQNTTTQQKKSNTQQQSTRHQQQTRLRVDT